MGLLILLIIPLNCIPEISRLPLNHRLANSYVSFDTCDFCSLQSTPMFSITFLYRAATSLSLITTSSPNIM